MDYPLPVGGCALLFIPYIHSYPPYLMAVSWRRPIPLWQGPIGHVPAFIVQNTHVMHLYHREGIKCHIAYGILWNYFPATLDAAFFFQASIENGRLWCMGLAKPDCVEWYLKVNVASIFVATVTSLLHFEHKNPTDAVLKVKVSAHLFLFLRSSHSRTVTWHVRTQTAYLRLGLRRPFGHMGDEVAAGRRIANLLI